MGPDAVEVPLRKLATTPTVHPSPSESHTIAAASVELSSSVTPSQPTSGCSAVALGVGLGVGLTLVALLLAAVILTTVVVLVCCAVRRGKTRGTYFATAGTGHVSSSAGGHIHPMGHIYADISDSISYEGTSLPYEQCYKSHTLLSTRYPPPHANDPTQWSVAQRSIRPDSCPPKMHSTVPSMQDWKERVEIVELPSSPKYHHHSSASLAIRQLSTASQDPLPSEAEKHLGTVEPQDGSGTEDQPTANDKTWRVLWPTYSHLLTQYPAGVEPLQRIKSQDL